MEETINKEFYLVCSKDINSIFDEIKDFLPNFKPWNLNQSYVLDADKTVLSTKTSDNNGNKEGYKIIINSVLNKAKYILITKDNYLSLEEQYYTNTGSVSKLYEVEYDGELVYRSASYVDSDKANYYSEEHDLRTRRGKNDYENSDSLIKIMKSLCKKDSQRIRN